MSFSSVSEQNTIDLTGAVITSFRTEDDSLTLCVKGAVITERNSQNVSGADCLAEGLSIRLMGGEVDSAAVPERQLLDRNTGLPHGTKEKTLCKSDLAELIEKLTADHIDADVISAGIGDNQMEISLNLNYEQDPLYILSIRFDSFIMEWEEFGRQLPKKKMTLKERAGYITAGIPAVTLAMSHKDTPFIAKIFAALAICYALSPIDLIPDFIPVIGYLDDLLILPGLLSIAIKLIPPEVMAECRRQVDEDGWQGIKSKWYFGLPIVLIWALILMIIISAVTGGKAGDWFGKVRK